VTDENGVVDAACDMRINFESVAGQGVRTILDGEDVTHTLRDEKTASVASVVASLPKLRACLLGIQRDFRQKPGLVADGRDMGTVVFPDAQVKIYLTASAKVRAERRFQQLKDAGINATLGSLLEDITERDARDSCRKVAPLRAADDAVVIDSSTLSIDDVCQQVLGIVKQTISR
jgi:cytidylate kinase